MPRRGLETIEYLRKQVVAFRPIGGMVSTNPGRTLPPGASPDMVNCSVFQGMLVKRPGYTQYRAGNASIGGAVTGLFSTQDVEDNTHLIALHSTGGRRYESSSASWAALTGPAMTGNSTLLFSFENSENKIVWSQGLDQVMVLSPITGTAYAVLAAACPPAKFLCRFNNRLNLGMTVESAVTFPYRHRRPVSGDHTDWSGLGSGFRDQAEFPYHMRGLRKLGLNMCIYYERTIEACIAQPQATAPFRYETRIADVGLYAAFTLKGRNDLHFFLGNDNFYMFNGSQVKAIGNTIRDVIFSTLNPGELRRMFAEMLLDTQEYVAFLVTGSATQPNVAWVYNWDREVWYPWDIDGPLCSTIHRLDDTLTIDELVGTIDQQSWQFDSRNMLSSYPAFLTGNDDGKVYLWSPSYPGDGGVAISCRWTSQDFTSENVFSMPGRKLTLNRLTTEYAGVGIAFTLSFYFSTDGGATWVGPYTFTGTAANSGFYTATIDRRVTADRIRFKFTHSSATEIFRISNFELEFELQDTQEYAA